MDELQGLSVLHERAMALNAERRVSQKDYEKLLAEANEDLERNKTAAKLRDLGAKHDVATAARVIPPFFGALKSRGHAACAKRCFGV